jgi:hypothetical protein
LNLQSPKAGGLQPLRLANAQPTHVSSTDGSRTHKPRRFELRRFASLRTALSSSVNKASPIGFEPTISTVTGWRALRAAPRGRVVSDWCPKQESNLQTLGFKPSRSASWRIRAEVVPDGLEPPLPGCGPGVVAARPRDCLIGAEAARLELATVLPAPVFKTGSSSGRMTSVKFRGLESNQRPPGSEPGVTTSSNCPGSYLH